MFTVIFNTERYELTHKNFQIQSIRHYTECRAISLQLLSFLINKRLALGLRPS